MINAGQRRRLMLLHTRPIRRDADVGNRADDRASDARSPPLDAIRITTKAKKRRGEHRLGSSGPPLLVRGSLINEPREERDCVSG